jgi:tetratricopeptide (TPR) repeat protein
MQVLLSLAEARGAVVTRDTLFRRCWGNAVASDDSLNHAIADLRRVFRQTSSGIEITTVPRTGYRLEVADGARPAEGSARIPRRVLIGGAASLAVATGAAFAIPHLSVRAATAAAIGESDQIRRMGLPEGDKQAVELLRRAVARDPESAAAWGRLALAQCALAEAAPAAQVAKVGADAQASARRALSLAPRQPDALAALALLPPYYGDWYASEQRMRAVLAVDPAHLPTRDALDFMLSAAGRGREGSLDRILMAAREPLHANYQFKVIYAHWLLGQINAADQAAERAMDLWPRHPGVWLARLWTLAFTGRPARALAHVEDTAVRPQLPEWMLDTLRVSMRALAQGRSEDRSRAQGQLIADVARGPSSSVNAVMILAALGYVDNAFDVANAYLLQEGPLIANVRWKPGGVAIQDQHRRKTNMLFVPVTAPMRADARFAALMERVGFKEYWDRSGVRPDYETYG